LATYLNLE